MLEKLKTWIKKTGVIEPFDPSRFNDPLAEEVEWSPQKRGGSNFHTHRLTSVDMHRLEFRATLGAKIFAGVFMIVGIGFPILFHTVGFGSGNSGQAMLFVWVFGLIFTGVGGAIYYVMNKPRVFDKFADMYWRGHKKPDYIYKPEEEKHAAKISSIHAIQLLREYVKSDKTSYYSYELNLVLNDGRRMNVIDHGNKVEITEDARKLGEFLDVPVWNAFEGM